MFWEHESAEVLAAAAAARVADLLTAAIAAKGRAVFAVPGGSTPGPFLTALGGHALDWSKITVIPSDERWAPPDHPRSNEKMIRETLFAAGAAPEFLTYWREDKTPEEAAPEVAAALLDHLPLDVAALGMGADMHCASLFPEGAGLAAAMAPGAAPVAAITAPGAPEPRVTLTAPVLAGAGLTLLIITGAEKRAAFDRAMAEGDALAAPIGGVMKTARCAETHWAP